VCCVLLQEARIWQRSFRPLTATLAGCLRGSCNGAVAGCGQSTDWAVPPPREGRTDGVSAVCVLSIAGRSQEPWTATALCGVVFGSFLPYLRSTASLPSVYVTEDSSTDLVRFQDHELSTRRSQKPRACVCVCVCKWFS